MATVTVAILLAAVAIAEAHDTFLRPVSYFIEPGDDLLVRVHNGTFTTSENSIARDRVHDASVLGPSGRAHVDTAGWTVTGDTSTFTFTATASGTYVLGASVKPNFIALTAKEFNTYLADEGIPDVLAARRRAGEMEKPARERYAKHPKALVQVGGARTNTAMIALGYPAELVPQANPYRLRVGDSLGVRALVDGKPAANQLVLFGGHTADGGPIAERSARTSAAGVVRVPLSSAGLWYVKFIHMARVTGDTVDYESKWATLTFEIR